LIYEKEDGVVENYTFSDFKTLSDRFANALQAAGFNPVKTRANDPALIIYTSGTTGPGNSIPSSPSISW